MDEGLTIYIDENGVAREYDGTYDITIHCESKEEQQEIIDRLSAKWAPLPEPYTEVKDE